MLHCAAILCVTNLANCRSYTHFRSTYVWKSKREREGGEGREYRGGGREGAWFVRSMEKRKIEVEPTSSPPRPPFLLSPASPLPSSTVSNKQTSRRPPFSSSSSSSSPPSTFPLVLVPLWRKQQRRYCWYTVGRGANNTVHTFWGWGCFSCSKKGRDSSARLVKDTGRREEDRWAEKRKRSEGEEENGKKIDLSLIRSFLFSLFPRIGQNEDYQS